MNIPTDPVILLSFVNTWLRDHSGGLDAFLEEAELDAAGAENLLKKLSDIGYTYDKTSGQFK